MSEQKRIMLDNAYHKKAIGEALTGDEIDMIIEFERESAIKEKELTEKLDIMQRESDERMEMARERSEIAKELMHEKLKLVRAKWQRMEENVQEK